jgi:hypothetical protein
VKRTLTLSRESLADLTSDELSDVVGALPLPSGLTCPLKDCLQASMPPRCE